MRSLFEITRQTLLLQLRSKVLWLLAILSLVFAAGFLFLPPDPSVVRGNAIFEVVTYTTGFFALLPFISLYLASQAVTGDLEDRTSVYLFTRPVSRVSILLGKWLAVFLISGLFATFAIGALYLVIVHGGREWKNGALPSPTNLSVLLGAAWLAVAGYTAVGCAFATFFRRPLLVSILYVVVEKVVSRMPAEAGVHSFTISEPVRRFIDQSMEASRQLRHILIARMRVPGGEEPSVPVLTDPVFAITKIVAVALIAAVWIYRSREYDSRPRD